MIEGCSIVVVMIRLRFDPKSIRSLKRLKTVLFASLAPLVKTKAASSASMSLAMEARPASTAIAASRPMACMLEALP